MGSSGRGHPLPTLAADRPLHWAEGCLHWAAGCTGPTAAACRPARRLDVREAIRRWDAGVTEAGAPGRRIHRRRHYRDYPRQGSNLQENAENHEHNSQPGTLPGTPGAAGDVVEILRILAGLSAEERAALLAIAREATSARRTPRPRSKSRRP